VVREERGRSGMGGFFCEKGGAPIYWTRIGGDVAQPVDSNSLRQYIAGMQRKILNVLPVFPGTCSVFHFHQWDPWRKFRSEYVVLVKKCYWWKSVLQFTLVILVDIKII